MTADLLDRLAVSALRFKFGWRVFRTVKYDGSPGLWCAATGSSSAWQGEGNGARVRPGRVAPDLILADTPVELAAKLRKRLEP